MPKKKNKNEPTGRRKRAYEMTNMINVQGVPRDPLRQIEAEALQELADEYRTLKMEQLIEKRRQDVTRLRDGTLDRGSMPSNADFMKMARMMSDLSPEEQKRVANAYAVLRMADKGQIGGSLQLLAPLMGFARANPGSSEGQMINYLKLMDGQMAKGIQLAQAVSPAQSDDSALKFLTIMKDLVVEGVRNPVLQALEKAQPQRGFFDEILMNPDLFSRFKEIGLFGGSRGGDVATSDMDLKIAQVTTANQLELKKLDLEWRKSMLEKEAADSKTNALVTALTPLSAIFAGPIDQRMRQFGQQQAATHNPAGMSPMPMPNTILIHCSCGYQGPMSFTGDAPPATVNCPQCGLGLNVQDTNPNDVKKVEQPPDSKRPTGQYRLMGVDEK